MLEESAKHVKEMTNLISFFVSGLFYIFLPPARFDVQQMDGQQSVIDVPGNEWRLRWYFSPPLRAQTTIYFSLRLHGRRFRCNVSIEELCEELRRQKDYEAAGRLLSNPKQLLTFLKDESNTVRATLTSDQHTTSSIRLLFYPAADDANIKCILRFEEDKASSTWVNNSGKVFGIIENPFFEECGERDRLLPISGRDASGDSRNDDKDHSPNTHHFDYSFDWLDHTVLAMMRYFQE